MESDKYAVSVPGASDGQGYKTCGFAPPPGGLNVNNNNFDNENNGLAAFRKFCVSKVSSLNR